MSNSHILPLPEITKSLLIQSPAQLVQFYTVEFICAEVQHKHSTLQSKLYNIIYV